MESGVLSPKRIDSLQVVRALAFLGILTFHCGTFEIGMTSVSVFILLSGFLMTYSYFQRDLSCSVGDNVRFSIKKNKRLYPLHIIMIVVSILLQFGLQGEKLSTVFLGKTLTESQGLLLQLSMLVSDLLLIQAWIPNKSFYFAFNGVAWYLSVSVFLYAVFPLILKCMKRFFSVRRAVCIAMLAYVAQGTLGVIGNYLPLHTMSTGDFLHWFTYIFPLFRLGDFLIGCCLGYIFLTWKTACDKKTATALEIVSVAGIAATVFALNLPIIGMSCFRFNVLHTPAAALLIWAFAKNAGMLSKALSRKPVLYIGRISPYGFLIHQPINRIIRHVSGQIWQTRINPWVETVIVLGLTILCCEAYLYAERSIQKKRNRI